MSIDIFLNQTLQELTDYFFWVYLNQNYDVKRYNGEKYDLLKGIIKDHNVLINEKNVYNQPIGSDIKGYDKIGKFTVYDY